MSAVSAVVYYGQTLRIRLQILERDDSPADLEGTACTIELLSPTNHRTELDATIEAGEDAYIFADVDAGDLDELGKWRAQGYVQVGDDESPEDFLPAEPVEFEVLPTTRFIAGV